MKESWKRHKNESAVSHRREMIRRRVTNGTLGAGVGICIGMRMNERPLVTAGIAVAGSIMAIISYDK